jgi:hypothetical protein
MSRMNTMWRYARWLLLCMPGTRPRAPRRNALTLLLYLFVLMLVLSVLLL